MTRFKSRKREVQAALKANRKKGLQAAAIEVASEAKRNAPVDVGRLRASIAWAADGERRTHSEEGVTYEVGAPEGTALVGTNVEYARYVHEGTGIHHAEGRRSPWLAPMQAGNQTIFRWTDGQAPNKFLERAAREKRERAIELIRKGLRGEL